MISPWLPAALPLDVWLHRSRVPAARPAQAPAPHDAGVLALLDIHITDSRTEQTGSSITWRWIVKGVAYPAFFAMCPPRACPAAGLQKRRPGCTGCLADHRLTRRSPPHRDSVPAICKNPGVIAINLASGPKTLLETRLVAIAEWLRVPSASAMDSPHQIS
jgi:hypothetical protein